MNIVILVFLSVKEDKTNPMMSTESGSGILIWKEHSSGDNEETLTSSMMSTLLEAINKLQLQQKELGNQFKNNQIEIRENLKMDLHQSRKEVTSKLDNLQCDKKDVTLKLENLQRNLMEVTSNLENLRTKMNEYLLNIEKKNGCTRITISEQT